MILQKTCEVRLKGSHNDDRPSSIDPARLLPEHLERAETDVLRDLLRTFVQALMGAKADALCGAPYGARSDERVNSRDGYRPRDWDTGHRTRYPASATVRLPAQYGRRD